ncbi:MAG: M3 family metallopeptidase [Candidatus Odinarchaeota archaeon]
MMTNNDDIWDLTVLSKEVENQKYKRTVDQALNMAKTIELDFKGTINSSTTTPEQVLELLKRMDDVWLLLEPGWLYGRFKDTEDKTDSIGQEIFKAYESARGSVKNHFTFSKLELGAFLNHRGKSFLVSPVLKPYRQFLSRTALENKYLLSDPEEQIVEEKDLIGIHEFCELHELMMSKFRVKLDLDGKKRDVSFWEAYSLFRDPDRSIRREAITKTLAKLADNGHVFTTCLRNICKNHVNMTKRRGYPSVLTPSLTDIGVDRNTVDSMIGSIESYTNLFHEFLLLKAKIFNSSKLRGEDLLAPYPRAYQEKIPWNRAKELVIDTFNSFDKDLGSIAREMFEKCRVDALPRPGKTTIGFCTGWYGGKSAFIAQSFAGTLEDIFTLAHEMGHAVHKILRSSLEYSEYYLTDVLSEGASGFAEMLLIDKLVSETTDEEMKKYLLFNTLNNLMINIFYTSMNFRFEESLYKAIENGEHLSFEFICGSFIAARNKYYGTAVDFLPEQSYNWLYVPHHFNSWVRFYNYNYAMGQLLALSLFEIYQGKKHSFVDEYKKLLEGASGLSAEEQLLNMDLDLSDSKFWEKGIERVEQLLLETNNIYFK